MRGQHGGGQRRSRAPHAATGWCGWGAPGPPPPDESSARGQREVSGRHVWARGNCRGHAQAHWTALRRRPRASTVDGAHVRTTFGELLGLPRPHEPEGLRHRWRAETSPRWRCTGHRNSNTCCRCRPGPAPGCGGRHLRATRGRCRCTRCRQRGRLLGPAAEPVTIPRHSRGEPLAGAQPVPPSGGLSSRATWCSRRRCPPGEGFAPRPRAADDVRGADGAGLRRRRGERQSGLRESSSTPIAGPRWR